MYKCGEFLTNVPPTTMKPPLPLFHRYTLQLLVVRAPEHVTYSDPRWMRQRFQPCLFVVSLAATSTRAFFMDTCFHSSLRLRSWFFIVDAPSEAPSRVRHSSRKHAGVRRLSQRFGLHFFYPRISANLELSVIFGVCPLNCRAIDLDPSNHVFYSNRR